MKNYSHTIVLNVFSVHTSEHFSVMLLVKSYWHKLVFFGGMSCRHEK